MKKIKEESFDLTCVIFGAKALKTLYEETEAFIKDDINWKAWNSR